MIFFVLHESKDLLHPDQRFKIYYVLLAFWKSRKWIKYLLLSLLQGVCSQPAWIQPTSVSVALGQTTKLSCAVSGSVNSISWYQQKSGQIPRYVHRSGGNRGDGIPDWFTASVSGSTGYLTITEILAEDEADYYCAMWHSSASSLHGGTIWWGTETETSSRLPQQRNVEVLRKLDSMHDWDTNQPRCCCTCSQVRLMAAHSPGQQSLSTHSQPSSEAQSILCNTLKHSELDVTQWWVPPGSEYIKPELQLPPSCMLGLCFPVISPIPLRPYEHGWICIKALFCNSGFNLRKETFHIGVFFQKSCLPHWELSMEQILLCLLFLNSWTGKT